MPTDMWGREEAGGDEKTYVEEGDLIGDLWPEDGGSLKLEYTEEEGEDGEDDDGKGDEEDEPQLGEKEKRSHGEHASSGRDW